jgi:hypothetical protein
MHPFWISFTLLYSLPDCGEYLFMEIYPRRPKESPQPYARYLLHRKYKALRDPRAIEFALIWGTPST